MAGGCDMVRLISQIINWLINRAWFAIRLAAPWIIRVFMYTVWVSLTAVASFWVGIPKAANQIADDWLDRAVRAGWPTIWDRQLRRILLVVAFATIVLGWIFLSFTTVFIVRLIF